ncbi:MAG TPA: hypothetical protein VIG24_07575 [Acidimicrobiia bacterium]
MDDETRKAVVQRLDTRCIKWPFVLTGFERRCWKCDGCVAARWVAGQ